jgi:hypothetical protein
MPIAAATSTEPKARRICVRASCQKAGARAPYSLRMDSPPHAPLQNSPAITTTATTRSPRRDHGPSFMRARASVSISARPKAVSQKPPPMPMRAYELFDGVRCVPASPISNAITKREEALAASLTAGWNFSRARAAERPSQARPIAVGHCGKACHRARPSPGTIRLALNTAKGRALPARMTSATSAPSGSTLIRARLASSVTSAMVIRSPRERERPRRAPRSYRYC